MNSSTNAALLPPFERWITSPLGQYVTAWERAQFNRVVADIFGYNAAQIGAVAIVALSESRIQCRAVFSNEDAIQEANSTNALDATTGIHQIAISDFDDLPIADESLDLIILPHLLELSADPHRLLREVDRVLRPEGKLIVTGFNPVSLWAPIKPTPRQQLIGLPRLRDWLKLLSFENDQSAYGCYLPPLKDPKWIERLKFLETAGDRWWPICGAVYMHCSVKKVHGMRIVGPLWKKMNAKAKAQPALAGKAINQRKAEKEIA
jgi:SAM-dependent methyltransferase